MAVSEFHFPGCPKFSAITMCYLYQIVNPCMSSKTSRDGTLTHQSFPVPKLS